MTGATPDADFSVATVLEEAAQRARPWPGDLPFTGNLERLLAACRRTGRLNPTGAQVLRKAAVRHLRNLAYVRSYVEANPGVRRRPLGGAVVVTGLPRTGTTLVHNLLALDPQHRVLRFWEALHPLPPGGGRPPAETLVAQAERWLEAFYRMVPEFRFIHAASPTGPEECDALLQNTFASQHFDDMFDAEEYSAWYAEALLLDEYEHYALQLRVLSAEDERPWALKSPSHLGHLDAVRAVLPGCTVVVCHRHPRQAVASYASLIHALRRAYSDSVSPDVVGQQALTRAATAMRHALDVRKRAGPSAFVDVSYSELVRDPVEALRVVYERRGRRLDAELEAAMRRWVAAHPADRHGPHRYDLAGFGLDAAEVDSTFASYLDGFGASLDA